MQWNLRRQGGWGQAGLGAWTSTRVTGLQCWRAAASTARSVEFIVDEQGRVSEPRVVHSSDRIFEEATLRAVARWQFEPGWRHGTIVRFRMTVPVLFNLNEGS